MPKKQRQWAEKAEDGAGSSTRRSPAEPLHRDEALELVAKQLRRNFAAEAQRLQERIQLQKWRRSVVDDELEGDPALLYWIAVLGHRPDEWFVTFEEFEKRRKQPEWSGPHRASFAVVSFSEEAVQARKTAHAVEQAAKAKAHFQAQVAADCERRGLSVA